MAAMWRSGTAGWLLLACAHAAAAQEADADVAANPAPADPVPTIQVFATTPLSPAQGDAQRAVSNVQTLDRAALQAPGAHSVAQSLQQAGSVFRSDAGGNPFQPDLFYRGYTISPLLGLPQGMAVYQDGVRVNEAFGDTVSLDLIPLAALQGADLVPGSNPVFGRNTLAGALNLRTRSGYDSPGLEAALDAGRYGQHGGSAGYGWAGDRVGLYAAGEYASEDGWRPWSHSRVARAFLRGTWLPDDATEVDLSFTGADNALRGNGAAPEQLLRAEGRDAVFTHADVTRPRLAFFNLAASRQLDGGARLSGGAYLRRNRIRTFNGDGTEYAACTDAANADAGGNPLLCEDAGADDEEVLTDADGAPVVAGADNDSATRNRSRTAQRAYGLSAQIEQPLGAHRLVAGVAADYGAVRFDSASELARLTDDRGTAGSGIVVGASIVDLHADNDSLGVYLMDTWSATGRLELTAAGRWNRTVVDLRDQLPDGDLSGRHRFSRFNPMLGTAYTLTPAWTAFGSLAQSTRAPTPVELTCANPDDPCRLPNGFVDDPPLDEVVTRTAELGLRHRGERLSGSLALFAARSEDDILFITDGTLANAGYFDNVGATRRQGLELGLDAALGRGWRAGLQLTLLRAEFRDDFLVNTPNHPLRDPSDPEQPDPASRQVRKGDRIPLIPGRQLRATLDWQGQAWSFGLEALGRGDARYRGDEANLDPQTLDGFVVLNADAAWKLTPQLTLYAAVDNLLDRDYATFGVYGQAEGVLGADYADARRFVGAGAPRRWSAGLRLRY